MAVQASGRTSALETELLREEMLAIAPAAASSLYVRFGKRALDVTFGSALLILLAPAVLVLATLVAVTSGFPPFYAAMRLGKDGRSFRMWKLRTMVRNADTVLQRWAETNPELAEEYEQNLKLRDDPRVTPLGRVLRRLSLDELPQLWNVVRGEMSLVGPRPYYFAEVAERPDVIAALVRVRPGMTGPWQVNGRNSISPDLRMRLDKRYVENMSAVRDIAYLAKTALCMLRADGL